MSDPQIIFAGNRQIGVQVLNLLCEAGLAPVALLLPEPQHGDKNEEMVSKVACDIPVVYGCLDNRNDCISMLSDLRPDYILSVHYPYLFSKEVLEVPRIGVLNLHPAYLPFNRGWHTPSWAILEGTPAGATLHWVDEGVDSGDISLQKKVEVRQEDTANSLYQRLLGAELELFDTAIVHIKNNTLPRFRSDEEGTFHKTSDLQSVQMIQANEMHNVGELIDRMRALTTNERSEAVCFVFDGKRYRVQIAIQLEKC